MTKMSGLKCQRLNQVRVSRVRTSTQSLSFSFRFRLIFERAVRRPWAESWEMWRKMFTTFDFALSPLPVLPLSETMVD